MDKYHPIKMFLLHVLNWKVVLDMWIPIVGYIYLYIYFGLAAAILVTAAYAVVCDLLLFSKRNFFIYALILFGVIESIVVVLLPDEYLSSFLAYKTALGSMQAAIVFLVFSLLKKPLPKIMAERFTPEILEWSEYEEPQYQRVWHEVSFFWILVGFLKALFFVGLGRGATEQQVVLASQVSGWPVYLMCLFFSFYWTWKRWLGLSAFK